MKLAAAVLFACVMAVAIAAPTNIKKEKENLIAKVLNILVKEKKGLDELIREGGNKNTGDDDDEDESSGEVDNGNKDDKDDPQPAEEKFTPPEGKFEGDIKLTPEQQKAMEEEGKGGENPEKRGVGLTDTRLRWLDNIVYYTLHSSLTSEARDGIRSAMADWQKYTCVRFVPATSSTKHYLNIYRGSGCWSWLGYSTSSGPGYQDLSIGPGCEKKGTIIHELAHAVGIIHEQSRLDRDNYVTIMWDNIMRDKRDNFEKRKDSSNNGFPYDLFSVMHYGDKFFSTNGRATIVPKQAGVTLGQRIGFSKLDVAHANKFLGCPTKSGPTQALVDKWPWYVCKVVRLASRCKNQYFAAKCLKSCQGRTL